MNELRQLILTLDTETVLALNGYFEAAGEFRRLGEVSYLAVMAVVMNRAEHPTEWPGTVPEVVAAHRQFSWTNYDDRIKDPQYRRALNFAQNPGRDWDRPWVAAKDAARRVVDAAVLNPVANATYYFNPHLCNPGWARNLHLVRDIGNHRFFAAPGDPEILWACKRAGGE